MSEFRLPILSDAFDVAPKDHIDISLDTQTLKYRVHYPSNHFVEGIGPDEVRNQIRRYNEDPDFLDRIVEYTTNWRRVAYFPATQTFFSKFPDGRINYGELGNSKRFSDDYIWRALEQEIHFE